MNQIEHLPFGYNILYEDPFKEDFPFQLGYACVGSLFRDDDLIQEATQSLNGSSGDTAYYNDQQLIGHDDNGVSSPSSASSAPSVSSASSAFSDPSGDYGLGKRSTRLDDELKWGSDSNFCFHGYSLPLGQWTEDRFVQNMMRAVMPLCRSIDIGSLVPIDTEVDVEHPQSQEVSLDWLPIVGKKRDVDDNVQPPQYPYSMSPDAGKKPNPLNHGDNHCPGHGHVTKKGAIGKKRCLQRGGSSICYCQKEKRRREIVRNWFDELRNSVPGMGNGTYTRRDILKEAAVWVESLVEGNKALYRKLEDMKKLEVKEVQES